MSLKKIGLAFWTKIRDFNGNFRSVNSKKRLLSDEDLEFIVKNTSISRGQIDDQYENFLEKHPDGKITKRNFRDMMQACFPESDIAKLESHIFRMYDKNGDGHIDFRYACIFIWLMILKIFYVIVGIEASKNCIEIHFIYILQALLLQRGSLIARYSI
jgi:hypothetical protein